MPVTKKRKCKNRECKKEFIPVRPLEKVCSIGCAYKLAKPIVRKETVKRERKEKRDGLEKLKPAKVKASELQDEVNKIARLIDWGNVCVSCRNYPKKPQGAHFRSVGGHTPIRFNLLNIWIGCVKCNSEEGGQVHGYDDGLIELFGKEYWEYLKFGLMKDYPYLGLKKEDYPELIKKARVIIKELEQDLKLHTPTERIELRKKYNEILGIYK